MTKIKDYLFQDWEANHEAKSRLVLFFFRLCQLLNKLPKPFRFILWFFSFFCSFFFGWFLSIELPWRTKIGKGLGLFHGHSVVVHHDVVIGHHCILAHSTTIGNKTSTEGIRSRPPQIGNYVIIGPQSVIIGPITIGDNVSIGAGSVVVKDVPSNVIIAGNPAKIIRQIPPRGPVNSLEKGPPSIGRG